MSELGGKEEEEDEDEERKSYRIKRKKEVNFHIIPEHVMYVKVSIDPYVTKLALGSYKYSLVDMMCTGFLAMSLPRYFSFVWNI